MNELRVIKSTRKTMQRLGFIKLICSIAPTSPDTINNFSERFYRIISRKEKISLKENRPIFELFIIKSLDSSTRYKLVDWNQIKSIIKENSNINYEIYVEIQDLYLSSPHIPSITGAIIPTEKNEMSSLTLQLGLIRENMMLTSSGSLIKSISTNIENLYEKYSKINNPLGLGIQDKITFLYYILQNDYDILKSLIPRIINISNFSMDSISEIVYLSIQDLITSKKKDQLTLKDKEYINRLAKTSVSIRNPKGKIAGTGRAIYQFFLPRMEWLCDLQIIHKKNKYSQSFSTNKKTKLFADFLERYDYQELTNKYYFQMINQIYNIQAKESNLGNEYVIQKINQISSVLKSQLNYVPLIESILLTNIHLMTSKSPFFIEIEPFKKIIRDYQKRHPRLVKYAIDRMGNIVSVRFT